MSPKHEIETLTLKNAVLCSHPTEFLDNIVVSTKLHALVTKSRIFQLIFESENKVSTLAPCLFFFYDTG